MSWGQLNRLNRTGVVATALLLFVCGSNFCLLSVLAGGSMSCLTAPGATPHAGTSHCGHALPQPAPGDPAPAGGGNSPCCVTVAPVQTLQIQKADAGNTPTVFALVEHAVESWRGVTRFGPLPEQKLSPAFHRAARHSGRAPPLS